MGNISKKNKKLAVNTTQINENGRKIFHPNLISWSKRYLGTIALTKENNIKSNVFTFSNDILNLITSSNLAITRCGASTLAELDHTRIPFIAVPLPDSVDNHQYLNAKHYKDKGICWIMEQINFSSINLFNLIMEIMNDKNKLKNIRNSMKKNGSKDVYIKVENAIREFI